MATRSLQDKVALVIGASSGMGRATSLALANEGAKVVCCDLRAEANPRGYEADIEKTTSQLIVERGGESIFEQVDISNTSQLEVAFGRAISKFGRLDILVNTSGYWAPFEEFVDETDEVWAKMVGVHTIGSSKAMRLAIRQFLKQEVDPKWGSRGRIVSISSAAACTALPKEVAYSATKASVNHMTRTAAMDHAKDWININCIAPGVVATGMARGNIEDEAILRQMKRSFPWPRLGTVDDITAAVLFFCLPPSSWITGQVLSVDGGMALGIPSE
ncbi:NAD(P)-binding protein [Lepidopterella palustris CBS 459.81]|uniref:NAD(P)-binding protein n=1 Tax=Lepidopterella palustris CBS 459.81 TaxID=1314670 RepID=A0A8E2DZK3_9PEZI|nr:NAD(P)-binding protein [Lepidopterella palustris CBS 459.81]